MQPRCTSCDAPIEWAILNRKPHPLDLARSVLSEATDVTGPLVETPIVERGGRVVRTITKKNPAPAGATVRTSHFATCPNADRHRRR